ncbi:hypothetical protein Bca101_043120 [Brassica carinata]
MRDKEIPREKLPFRKPPTVDGPVNGKQPTSEPTTEHVSKRPRDTDVESSGQEGQNEEEAMESESSEGDDCEVVVEDTVGYKETVDMDDGQTENEPELVNVRVCDNLEDLFGDVARGDDTENSDEEIGVDMWDGDAIPDPLLDSDAEKVEGIVFNQGERPDDLLRYSLKRKYDIAMYKSSSDRLGARCTQYMGEKCPWRVYCSFEKGRNKLMVKVFINEHTCVRSDYTMLLKSGSTGQLYEERLRLNPKIKPKEMEAEIKREYNMIVSIHQCRRVKKVLANKRKAGHEAQFARLWDYQEEIRKSNRGSTMEIETIPGPVPGSLQRFNRLCVYFAALKNNLGSYYVDQ